MERRDLYEDDLPGKRMVSLNDDPGARPRASTSPDDDVDDDEDDDEDEEDDEDLDD